MIRALLPGRATGADAFGDAPEGVLLPAEEAVVADVAAGRRREFATVRHCARRALRELGGSGRPAAPVALLPDGDGVPRWPAGVVGSLTHTRGYRAAAVALAADVARLGIDAEPDRPLRAGVLETIALPAERAALPGPSGAGVCWDRLLFCAKEAAYKAWFPQARVRLGFRDVEVAFCGPPADGRFRARIRHGSEELLGGRWAAGNGLLLAVVAVPARHVTGGPGRGPGGGHLAGA
ncbi:4'-phosphopantetheinyl transferase superfamily protein [Streptomyces sp. NBC_01232]|uniref:4'-phosphopantetheinyl transferase family protein n=1 Tax=Streptomyces sp. NBC_01232 TaxID=2903786 RepID=UPI002E0FAAD7|nr:4'-phosphopantetheinyl transferase superfamily protein [Streptomyces sp. NBC_01232]